MCGLSGAGKSTFARALESTGWLRLSIDVAAWEQGHTEHPLPSGIRDAIVAAQREEIHQALRAGRDVVVDYAFWSREMRDEYRELGRAHGSEVSVVFCDAPVDELRRRLRGRSQRGAGADTVEVSDDLLDQFVSGFERPGPDEVDVKVITSQRDR